MESRQRPCTYSLQSTPQKRDKQIHKCVQKCEQQAFEERIFVNTSKALERIFLESKLLSAYHRRRTNRSNPEIHRKSRWFAKTFGCVRFIYNRMLSDKTKHYEETKQKLINTPAQYKAEFPWLKEVDSLALANAQMNLQTAYNNFFRSPETGFPKFKSKKSNRKSYTTNFCRA